MNKHYSIIISILLTTLLCSGCATFRSGIKGEFSESGKKNYGAEKVSVLFVFSHYEQAKGYDAIPKLESKRQIINDFDDFFFDALNELSNVGRYTTFTEYASDVGNPKRRAEKDSLITTSDFVIRMKFTKENSFTKHFLGTLFSTMSATLLPIPYTRNYSITVNVFNNNDVLIKRYVRQSSLTKWVQTFLIFIYPFHTERRKEEEIYIGFMHDIFKQIETERVLMVNGSS
ncbi:MAG: hypothetical protein P9X24_07230 [Candidatus Hatepunaea meridiana]|nr:hypothetical protein [Candidatus Hatepunaea meridiana]